MIRKHFLALATAAGIVLSAAAFAQQAVTTRTANVRAGPAADFPVVVTLPPGAQVNVAGCVNDYLWCDVDFGGGRGWLSTRVLQTYYDNRLVPLYGYGANIGYPIVTFSLFDYWDSYYRNRPFYRDRPRFEQRWGGNRGGGYDRRPGNAYVQPRPEYRQPQQFDRQRPQMDRQQFDRQRAPQVQQGPRNEPNAGRPGGPQVQTHQERQPMARAPEARAPQAPQGPQGRPGGERIERAQPNTDQGR